MARASERASERALVAMGPPNVGLVGPLSDLPRNGRRSTGEDAFSHRNVWSAVKRRSVRARSRKQQGVRFKAALRGPHEAAT
eukprot:10379116-Alexandrium_andersonii.AAC.1